MSVSKRSRITLCSPVPLCGRDLRAFTTADTEDVEAKGQKLKARKLLPHNPLRQFRARNCDLFPGRQMLERERIRRRFVFADDEDISRLHLVGHLERLF